MNSASTVDATGDVSGNALPSCPLAIHESETDHVFQMQLCKFHLFYRQHHYFIICHWVINDVDCNDIPTLSIFRFYP